MTKRKRWQVTETLDKPILMSHWPGCESDQIWQDELLRLRRKKKGAYLKHFKITQDSPDAEERLAFMLGEGFRAVANSRPHGAPRKLSQLNLLAMQAYIDRKLDGGSKNEMIVLREYLTDWYKKSGKRPPTDTNLKHMAQDLQKKLSKARKDRAIGKAGLGYFF